VIVDVPPILAQVDGDPICPVVFGLSRGEQRIGFVRLARLPDGRHMVDVT